MNKPTAKSERVTLKDIARLTGVSVSTASAVLVGKGAKLRISAEVQQRVREAAREQGYAPNLLVRQDGTPGKLNLAIRNTSSRAPIEG